MLQHLAQGIYGAHGLKPQWIHLERPGMHVDLTDPLNVASTPSDRSASIQVHVRERFGWKVATFQPKRSRTWTWMDALRSLGVEATLRGSVRSTCIPGRSR